MTMSKEEAKQRWREIVQPGVPMMGRTEFEFIHEEFDKLMDQLGEAPAKVVVSKTDAEILRGLDKFHFPVSEIARQSETTGHQDRLMRAYVLGWTVEKPKRWNVKVPHTELYYWKMHDDEVGVCDKRRPEIMPELCVFTAAEIEHYELTDCEKVVCADSARTTGEVTDDEQ